MKRLALGIFFALSPGLFAGCPRFRLPEPSGCEPFTSTCTPEGQPAVCSATRRWTPVGDLPCAQALPGARCVAPAPSLDAGADAAPDAPSAGAGVAHCEAP